jgi:hypothetical protein
MKRYLQIIWVFFLLIFIIGLAGCTNQNVEDGVTIVTYSIETQRWNWGEADFVKIADGFIYSEDAERYEIIVTVKNVAGVMINRIVVSVNFYNKNNSYLGTKVRTIRGLDASHTEDISFTYTKYEDNFENVDHLEFEIDT